MARPHIFLATHHKGGTVWMMTTFIRLAQANGWTFIQLNKGDSGWRLRDDRARNLCERMAENATACEYEPAVFHDYHSAVPQLGECLGEREVRGVHIIRDPRDMLLSAVRFHLVSNEPWLDEHDERWGMSFRSKLAALPTLEERIAFEMDTYMGWTIERMASFDEQGVFMGVKYEDLVVDRDMQLFHSVLSHLELRGQEIVRGLEAHWRSSLFGERPESDERSTASHVFDSRPAQWQHSVPPTIVEMIEARFGTEIVQLGYPLSSERARPTTESGSYSDGSHTQAR